MKTTPKITLIAIAAALASCSGEETSIVTPNADAKQYITVRVSDVNSRAGRELQNAEAGQNIENVKIVLVDNANKVVWTTKLEKWNTNDAVGGSVLSDDKTYREARIEIPKDEYRMLTGDVYHAYAYGYANGSDYDTTPLESLKPSDPFTGNLLITLKDGKVGEEIFAGDCQILGNADGVDASMVLNRQVAGAFGYLNKIPYVYDAHGNVGAYLLLSVSNPQKSIMLGEFDNSGAGSAYTGKNVVNGTSANETSVIYSISLADWFKEIVEEKEDSGRGTGLIATGDNWKGDPERYKVGSVYGGNFLVPFSKVDGKASLVLSLCYENDLNTAMRTWNVLLPTTASQLSQYSVLKYSGSAWVAESTVDDNTVYNVLRNRLYGIGVKAIEALNAGTPDNPDDDPEDEPVDLNNKQVLTITVNGEWNTIYNMGVE